MATKQKTTPPERPAPFELAFININDPGQSKDQTVLRGIRRHVMRNYLYKNQQDPNSTDHRRLRPTPRKKRGSSTASFSLPSRLRSRSEESPIAEPTRSSEEDIANTSSQPTAAKSGGSSTDMVQGRAVFYDSRGKAHVLPSALEMLDVPSLIERFPCLFRCVRTSFSMTLGTDDRFGLVGNAIGGFHVFRSPEVNIELLRTKGGEFATPAMALLWYPMIAQAKHSFLSIFYFTSVHEDVMRSTLPGHPSSESRQSAIIRSEMITMVNDALDNPAMRFNDTTLAAVLQIMAAETIFNHQTSWIHEQGLERMIEHRGGLDQLGSSGKLAAFITIASLMFCVHQERRPNPIYVNHASTQQYAYPPSVSSPSPESPLYMFHADYRFTRFDRNCNKESLRLLKLLHSLTSAFVTLVTFSAQPYSVRRHAMRAEITSLASRIQSFAATDTNLHCTQADRRYEAIRLTSRIYVHALEHRLPFSQTHSNSQTSCGVTPLMVKQALVRTDVADCWDNMAGVLFWITLVAGSACGNVPILDGVDDVDQSTRRWMATLTARVSVLLGFEHTAAVMQNLRKMVLIQEALRRGKAPVSLRSSDLGGPDFALPGDGRIVDLGDVLEEEDFTDWV